MTNTRPLEDHINNIFRAISFIEDNLGRSFSMEQLAKHAAISKWHFQRIFSHLVGESVKSYVKRRRLTVATKLLLEDGLRPVDVAMRVGFKSAEAFSRAFLSYFDVTPGEFKKAGKQATLPKLRPALSRAYLEKMFKSFATKSLEVEVVTLSPGKYIAKKGYFHSCFSEKADGPEVISEIWQDLSKVNRGLDVAPVGPSWGFIELPKEGTLEEECCSYLASLAYEEYPEKFLDEIPTTLVAYDFPGGLYAAIENSNPPESIVQSLDYLLCVWLYQSEYSYELRPEVECYPDTYLAQDPKGSFKYYLPIVSAV